MIGPHPKLIHSSVTTLPALLNQNHVPSTKFIIFSHRRPAAHSSTLCDIMFAPKKTIFLAAVALAILFMMATTMVAAVEELKVEDEEKGEKQSSMLNAFFTSLRGVSSFFYEHKITCKRDPRICNVSGSPGPYCCKKVCVNINSDHRNCGGCKNKCKNKEMCCSGRCTLASKGCGTSAELALQEWISVKHPALRILELGGGYVWVNIYASSSPENSPAEISWRILVPCFSVLLLVSVLNKSESLWQSHSGCNDSGVI